MRYDYRCVDHGVIEVSHGIKESREGRLCPNCKKEMKPIITLGSRVLLTGRPPWAYNDVIRSASASENAKNGYIKDNIPIIDKRDGSKYKGQRKKLDRSMGDFNAQW